MLGYHLLLVIGILGHPLRAGTFPRWSRWIVLLSLMLPLAAFLIPQTGLFPNAIASNLLSQWPGGLASHGVYALLVNTPLEEGFWRGVINDQHPGWSPLQHGLAFGLHHLAAAIILLPPLWWAPAYLGSACAGWLWTWVSRRTHGLGLCLFSHACADLALVTLVAHQLH